MFETETYTAITRAEEVSRLINIALECGYGEKDMALFDKVVDAVYMRTNMLSSVTDKIKKICDEVENDSRNT